MKPLKNLLSAMLLALLFCGCEKEEGIPEKATKEQEFTIEEINFGQISDKSLVSEVFQKVKNPTKGSFADKVELYNFTIDSSRIKRLERNGRTTYIFLVKRDSLDLERFENLVVFKDSNNTTKAFLLEYLTDHAELMDAHSTFSYEGNPKITPLLDTEGLDMAAKQIRFCYSVTVTLCSWGGIHHIAGKACNAANDGRTYTVTQTNCVWFDDGGDGGGGGGGGPDPGDDFDNSPIGDDLTLELKNFVKYSLSLTERPWFYAASDTFRKQIATFLDAHNFSDQAKTLADEMVALNHRLNYFMGHLELSYLIENPYWAEEINDFLDEDNSQYAIGFATEAIKALARGGSVDFVDKIINNLTGKAKCVYDKLLSLSTSFKDAIQEFDGDFPVAHLIYSMDYSLPNNTTAVTNNSGEYTIEIRINGNIENQRTVLGLARTFAHETIHAELYRKVRSVGGMVSIDDFPGIYDYYRRYVKDWQHQQMAAHYRSAIVDILKEMDNNQHSDQFYDNIAWEGLHNTEAWNNLSNLERTQITNVISNFKLTGNKNCN